MKFGVGPVLRITCFRNLEKEKRLSWSKPEPSLDSVIVISDLYEDILENKENIEYGFMI